MKKLLLASCTVLSLGLCAPAALAGDIGLAGSTYDWSGGYVGLNAGAAFNTTKFRQNYTYAGQDVLDQDTLDLIDGLDSTADAGDTGFTGGVLAGYNWQYANFVIGAEADFNYLGFDNTVKNNVSDVMSQVLPPENTIASDKISYQTNSYGTLRARLGYAANNVLIYGTGGLAYGKTKIKQTLEAYDDAGDYATWKGQDEGWKAGWTLGGGIEYAQGRWVLGAEYLYVDLGTYDWGSKADVSLGDDTLNADWGSVKEKGKADVSINVARATIKYRF
ncbi:MAG: porin family protein [Hyphomicrobiales bacterium]